MMCSRCGHFMMEVTSADDQTPRMVCPYCSVGHRKRYRVWFTIAGYAWEYSQVSPSKVSVMLLLNGVRTLEGWTVELGASL